MKLPKFLKLQRCTVEQTVDKQAPQAQEKLVDVIQLILQERISEHIGAKLAPRIQEEVLEVIQLVRRDRISGRSAFSVPQMAVETVKHVRQEQVQSYAVEQEVGVPVPRFLKESWRGDPANSAAPSS